MSWTVFEPQKLIRYNRQQAFLSLLLLDVFAARRYWLRARHVANLKKLIKERS